jgi:hypothetical protein
MRANNYLSGLKVESSRRIAAGYGSASVDVWIRIAFRLRLSQVTEPLCKMSAFPILLAENIILKRAVKVGQNGAAG